MSDKLEKNVSLRFSKNIKRAMEDLAEKGSRSFNKEVEIACAEYIHRNKFKILDYTNANRERDNS